MTTTLLGGRPRCSPLAGTAADTLPAAPGDGGPPADAAAGTGPKGGLFRPALGAAPRPPGGELTTRRSTGVAAPSAAARQVRDGSERRAGLASAARRSGPPNEGDQAVTGDQADERRDYEPACIPHLGYELHVERPRRNGVDAAYQALMNEALADAERHHREAS